MNKAVSTDLAPKATGPFSQAVISDGSVFTSGQIYLKIDGTLVEGSIEEKTHQVMQNLEAVLKEAGVTFSDVVKTTIYVTDMSNYAKVNEVYATYMKQPFPARETVCVHALPLGAEVEISMVARIN